MFKKKKIYDIEFLLLLIPTIYWIYVGKQNENQNVLTSVFACK